MAFLVKELAEWMASSGHHVDVLTGYPNWPSGKCFEGYDSRNLSNEKMGDLTVYRVPFYAAPNGAFLQRVLDFKSFEFAVRKYGKMLPRPDLIYVSVPPNEDAIAASLIAKHFKCPYVLNIQDMQPDSAIELGYVKNKLIISLLKRQEDRMYRNAHHITVIGENFKQRVVAKGIPEHKVSIIPNWINANDIVPMDRINSLRCEWEIPEGCFVVLYAGTFGRVHNTSLLLDAANMLHHDERIVFLLVGQGYDFQRNKELVEQMGLKNVMMKEFIPRARLSELQALADISIVMLRPGFGNTSVPSKLLGYMSAGRGVLAVVDSECDTAYLVQNANCGAVLDPVSIDTLVWWINYLQRRPEIAVEWGRNARNYVLENLDSHVVVKYLSRLIVGFV